MDDCMTRYYLILAVETNSGYAANYTDGTCRHAHEMMNSDTEVVKSRYGDVKFNFMFSSSVVSCI